MAQESYFICYPQCKYFVYEQIYHEGSVSTSLYLHYKITFLTRLMSNPGCFLVELESGKFS